MGGSSSTEWKGYQAQLMADKVVQSIEVPNSAEKGTTPIYRNPKAKDGFQMFLKQSDISKSSSSNSNSNSNANPDPENKESDEMSTGWACVENACRSYGDLEMVGYRPFNDPKDIDNRGKYRWDTYKMGYDQILQVGNGLRSLGIEDRSNVGIFAINRPEWIICHFGNWSQSYRTVALYDTLGAQAVQYIVWHAELRVIFVEKNKLAALFEAIRSCPPEKRETLHLQYIVQFDYQERYGNKHEAVDQSDKDTAQSLNVELMGLSELIARAGAEKGIVAPTQEDIAYIMYTSGTTGDPKGVILPHQSFACTVASSFRLLSTYGEPMNSKDVHCSYLPLAHCFEANVIICMLSGGGRVAFWGGNIKKISMDWKELRPTMIFGVPRIYNKTYDKVQAKVRTASAAKKWVFSAAQKTSMSGIRTGGRSSFYDKLVWNSLAQEIGFDRVRYVVSGAAPLPPHVAEFLRVVCGNAVVAQGYGLTETCAVSFTTQPNDLTLGHVGIPVDNLEYRLVDAPECEYYVTDKPYPRGEIQMRGPTIMRGYFKNEEATKKTLSEDGWLSTGDIGRVNPNGTLSIIDRRKNMFKTAMGEYVAAEKVEIIYTKSPCVNQIWIYGNSFKSFVVAILVPDPLWLVPILKQQKIWPDEGLTPATRPYCDKFRTIVGNNYAAVKKMCTESIKELEKETDLKKFEKIRDFHIEFDLDELFQGFTVANGCTTPTFKLKRPQLLKRYKEQIKQLYADNGEPPKEDENW